MSSIQFTHGERSDLGGWPEAHIMTEPASCTVDGTGVAPVSRMTAEKYPSSSLRLCPIWPLLHDMISLLGEVLNSSCTTVDRRSTIGACCEPL